jgi:hypothetical protein
MSRKYLPYPGPIDAEIEREIAFDCGDGLNTTAAAQPRVVPSSLVDVA